MGHSHTETEHTYQGADLIELPDLRGLPGVARVRRAPEEELDAVYYDTADLALLGTGVTLRRRTGGHDAGWHLKVPERDGRTAEVRKEYRLPLDAAPPGTAPPEFARRVRARARGRDIAPVAHLRTRRARHLLQDARDRTLVEIAEDHVSAQVLGADRVRPGAGRPEAATRGSAGTTTHVTAWSEVEAELVGGGEELLAAIDRRLAGAGLRRQPAASKLRHAMEAGERAPATPAEPRRGTAGEVVLARLREQRAVLLDADAAVRADEADSVHRMRVAVRRLRSALTSYRRLYLPGATRDLTLELRWLGQVLGAARDPEVLGERLRDDARRLAADPATAPLTRGLAGRVAAQEATAYRRAWRHTCEALDGDRYFALLDALDAHLARPPFGPRAAREATGELRAVVRREHRRLRRRVERVPRRPAGTPRDRALHDVRKAARRVRYAAETAGPVLGKPATRLAKRAKELQRVLGVHQDTVVARSELPVLADSAHASGHCGYGYGLLHARQEAAARAAERDWPAAWRRLRKAGRRLRPG